MRHLLTPWPERSVLDRYLRLGVWLVALITIIGSWVTQSFDNQTFVVFAVANELVTPSWVMKEIGRRLVNNLKFAGNVMRSYDKQYVQSGAKVGFTVNARLPQRFKVNKGQALNPQPVVDTVVPITLTDQANVGIEFSTASLTMEVDNYREKCIAPAVDTLGNAVDSDGLSRMYKRVYWHVGTPGTDPTTNQPYLNCGVKLDLAACPEGDRVAVLSPGMHAALANANVAIFNPTAQISEIYRKGQFGKEALGISEWFKDQNVEAHTVGDLGGAPLINLADQTGSVIDIDGWTAAVGNRLREGDVLQFAGSRAVNPQSYKSTGQLQDQVVLADVDSDAAGVTNDVPISPGITVAGNLQNVTASPANNAVVTIFGHASTYAGLVSSQGLIYHPEAFALVMADLEMPQGLWVSEHISNEALGIAIRFLKDYSIMTDLSPARVDILYGWKEVRPEMACRISGA